MVNAEILQLSPKLRGIAFGGELRRKGNAVVIRSAEATAAMDVFEGEPALNAHFPNLDKALLRLHHASGTFEMHRAMGALARDNLIGQFDGKPLLTPVL